MSYSWSVHYVNEVTPAKELFELIKKFSATRFSINELRFKDQKMRDKFQTEILDQFRDMYKEADLQHNIDWKKIYDTQMDEWKTPYGVVRLSDSESRTEEFEEL